MSWFPFWIGVAVGMLLGMFVFSVFSINESDHDPEA